MPKLPIARLPLGMRDWYIFLVASLEQLIGAALSTIVGIMIPLMLLLGKPPLTALEQGLLGAAGLTGIAAGSFLIGKLMDIMGYLFWFRFCPLLIAAASAGVYLSDEVWSLFLFLFLIGIGVGGGYTLDSGYISELMPAKWKSFFVGLAKATSSLGFIGGALASYFIIKIFPNASIWPKLILVPGALGLIAFLTRLRWSESPSWLMAKGEEKEADKAAREFFGRNAEANPIPAREVGKSIPMGAMFKGENLKKVIFSGLSWACEGLGVYGFGVFLPILVMALGMGTGVEEGMPKVLESVKTTIFINLFIAAGFGLGLAILHKVNIAKLMGWGFIACVFSLALLLAAHKLAWPVWVSFTAFVIFETALNAGPHLVTFIAPSRIFPIDDRGAGMGIATMLGKLGAISGVFLIPMLLSWGGVTAVLLVSIGVQALGAIITFAYGKMLKLM